MKKRLSDLVIKKVRDYIENNRLKVGNRLPNEQEMADLFGVSRIIVHEANKAFDFMGVIKATSERGLTVGPFNMERVSEILRFHFLINDYPKELLRKTRIAIEIGSLQYALAAISSDFSPFIERFIRSIKYECLNRMLIFGETHLRYCVTQYISHYHSERAHQSLDNNIITPLPQGTGEIKCHERLGGLLKFYRAA
jgi:DNA-binding transcriptional regulator YhcF (GntR family)